MEEEDVMLMSYLEKNYWFWNAKKNLYKKAIKKYAKKVGIALDVGCGAGAILDVLESFNYDIYGIDSSEKSISICRQKRNKSNLQVANAEDLPFKNKFDIIITSDVLEHCNDKKAIKSIYNALKEDGVLIATVPMSKHLWGYDDVRLKHMRRYSKKMLKKLLSDFKIIKMSYTQMLLYFPALIARVLERKFGFKKSFEAFFKERIIVVHERTKHGQTALTFPLPIKVMFFFINWFVRLEQYVENTITLSLGLPFGVGMIVVCRKK